MLIVGRGAQSLWGSPRLTGLSGSGRYHIRLYGGGINWHPRILFRFVLFLCIWIFACMYLYVPHTCLLDLLELGLRATVWVVRIELGFSRRTASALNFWIPKVKTLNLDFVFKYIYGKHFFFLIWECARDWSQRFRQCILPAGQYPRTLFGFF